jgi:hypothetical protein
MLEMKEGGKSILTKTEEGYLFHANSEEMVMAMCMQLISQYFKINPGLVITFVKALCDNESETKFGSYVAGKARDMGFDLGDKLKGMELDTEQIKKDPEGLKKALDDFAINL